MPDCFWDIATLDSLRLEGFALTGGSSQQDPLLRLPPLQSIDLYHCFLLKTGQTVSDNYTIQWSSLLDVSGLHTLKLRETNIEGQLPNALPSNLRSFYLQEQPLISGPIPSGFLSALTSSDLDIRITGTSISGPIPGDLFSAVSTGTLIFDFGNNKLSGSIPEALFSNATLTGVAFLPVSFGGNNLEGTLPTSLFPPLSKLSTGFELRLHDNRLSGPVTHTLLVDMPISAGWSSVLIDLSGNGFTGTIPQILTNLNSSVNVPTFSLNLARNKLEGAVPTTIWPPATTRISTVNLDFSSNLLTGNFPVGVFRNIPSTIKNASLWFAGNSLSGFVPPALFENPSPMSLTKVNLSLAQNQFTGTVATALIAQAASRIEELYIDLSSNNFGGTIPNTYFNPFYTNPGMMKKLSISLANCSLTGSIPSMQTKLSSLHLNFDSNRPTASLNWNNFFQQSSSDNSCNISLSAAHNGFSGTLGLAGIPTDFAGVWDLNFYGNDFTSFTDPWGGSFPQRSNIRSLNVGMNPNLEGTFLDVFAGFETLIANGTKLSSYLRDIPYQPTMTFLDLRGTDIEYCEFFSSPPYWSPNLLYCRLNAAIYNCSENMPEICTMRYEGDTDAPGPVVSPSSPASGPNSPTGPESPNSPQVGIPTNPNVPTSSGPSNPSPTPIAAASSISGLGALILAIPLLLLVQ